MQHSARRRSRNSEQRVTLFEEEGEATSDATLSAKEDSQEIHHGHCTGQQQ